jgi:hypothetical protein
MLSAKDEQLPRIVVFGKKVEVLAVRHQYGRIGLISLPSQKALGNVRGL